MKKRCKSLLILVFIFTLIELAFPLYTKAQPTKSISGKVIYEKKQPITGATIIVKGTANGPISDAEGKFGLKAVPEDILIVSFIGYKNLVVKIGNNTNLTIRFRIDQETCQISGRSNYAKKSKDCENLAPSLCHI